MNYRGSYRHLLKNSQAALLAAIEIYNKPRIEYRDETVVILLINAWELILKALVSKNGGSIFYRKRRHEPYKTLSCADALSEAERYFPTAITPLPVRRNLELLTGFRDNAVHFYNQAGFSAVIYALAQTSIVNYRDLLSEVFHVDLAEHINWALLPLGISPPVDPVEYIAGRTASAKQPTPAVRQFLLTLASAADEVKKAGSDTGRLLTVFNVKLESTKKIQKADVLVGVEKQTTVAGPLAIVRTVDPNISHPLRQKEVVAQMPDLHGIKFTPHVFQAIVWKYKLKEDLVYCWRATGGVLTRYSNDILPRIRQLGKADLETALADYRAHCRKRKTNSSV
jgi:hypothetical protein